MSKHKVLTFLLLVSVLGGFAFGAGQAQAQYVPPPQLVPGVNYMVPNYANSPILAKFKDALPGLTAAGAAVPGFYSGANLLGQHIPVAVPMAVLPAGVPAGGNYYEIALVDYTEQMHSNLPATKLRGYVQIEPPGAAQPAGSLHVALPGITYNGFQVYGYDTPSYLGPVIVATHGTPTRIKFYNLLAAGTTGDLFLPTDTTIMGAGTGPDGVTVNSQNRATLHLHGGDNPWISDGTAHQWITPKGQAGNIKGASQQNVPDMPQPVAGDGTATFYWPNGQSGRLMFYHDHAFGMTRLDVYAGEAAGYLLVDPPGVGENSIASVAAMTQVPLVIQDKAFVNIANPLPAGYVDNPLLPYNTFFSTPVVDPLWNTAAWGGNGSLWFPHVYMPNQNPNDLSGANPLGRWDYGPWFWPIFPSGVPPQNSSVPETFVDTPLVNGTAYPVLNVNPTTYRFRVLNATNDRYVNLQLYKATPGIVSGIMGGLGGTGCIAPLVTIAGGGGVGATATATTDPITGAITAINLLTVGSGYTAAPTVTITDAALTCVPAAATATIYTAPTEVGMVPASKFAGIGFPGWWSANDTPGMTPNILDGRQGGVPDPAMMGPSFIHIGSEGGLSPLPVVLKNTPIGYEQNKRSVTVLNTYDHTLFLGPAERADVIVDFSQFAGKTLILYNDAPAPLPAGDPRNDYYTAGPGLTDQGGPPPTQPGFGPNTRTVMQIVVAAGANAAFDPTTLTAPLAAAFAATQPIPVVPEPTYLAPAVPAGVVPATYSRISDTSLTFTPYAGAPEATGAAIVKPLQPKTIQELFDPLGRMNSTLGVEIPFTTAVIQTTIPYGFADPPTEVIANGETQLWKITHNGVDTHALHFHLFNVQVINRIGWDGAVKPPWPEELGWKETVKMNPLEDIVVAMRVKTPTVPFQQPNSVRLIDQTQPVNGPMNFTNVNPVGNPYTVLNTKINFGAEYTWHCHLLGHEENDMMRAVAVAQTPLAPSALNNTILANGNVRLTWTNNASTTTYTGLSVLRATNPDMVTNLRTVAIWSGLGTPPATYTDLTAQRNTGYYYMVAATNTVGSQSYQGTGAAVVDTSFPVATAAANSTVKHTQTTTGPTAPTAVTATAARVNNTDRVTLRWTAGAGQTSYSIQYSTDPTFPTGLTTTVSATGTATSYTTGSLPRNTNFYFRIQGVNVGGTSQWVSATPAPVLTP